MFKEILVLGIYAITPVHAGSGTELSVVDLPIQRERHTRFPVIWGQSLKGALRAKFEAIEKGNISKSEAIFGPPTDKAHEHAGAISVSDAKLLLFPVRSAKGVFAYITCPLVLERFLREVRLAKTTAKREENSFAKLEKTLEEAVGYLEPLEKSGTRALASQGITSKNQVILEDVILDADPVGGKAEALIKDLINGLEKLLPILRGKDVKSRLAVVPNNIFRDLVEFTTEIVARIRINPSTGTVETGGLWYEEFLPSDSVLYSLVAVADSRKDGEQVLSAESIAAELFKLVEGGGSEEASQADVGFLQIGGDETVGKGFVEISLFWNGRGGENATNP